MQLDKLIIETRIRSAWSSIDLGFALARIFWFRSVLLYLILAIPVFLITRMLVSDVSILPYIILWWLKPLFERPILYLMSRELFAEPMPVRRVLSDFWLWLKPSFFWIVTIRRLSIYRGMVAPISLLEQPSNEVYSKRASVLGSKYSSEAMWLNIVLLHVESLFGLAVFGFIILLVPQAADFSFWDLLISANGSLYLQLISVFVIASIAPFYVSAGFMLYISRRVELEGWDIEITFRNWMSGYQANSATSVVESSAEQRA